MARPAVDVHVGGQLYRVVTSAGEQSLQRYANVVNQRLRELTGNHRTSNPQALLLVALALAHDLEEERARRAELCDQQESVLRELLERIDTALDGVDENGEPLPPLPAE